MEASRIYMSPVYDGGLSPVTLEDEYGKINVWMLPFVKPVHVRRFNEDAQINSYTDAVRVAVENLDISIEKGRIYGLVGTNGSGKSTFLRTVCGVYYPDEEV